jgi:hypothetical protein
VEGIKEGKGRY